MSVIINTTLPLSAETMTPQKWSKVGGIWNHRRIAELPYAGRDKDVQTEAKVFVCAIYW